MARIYKQIEKGGFILQKQISVMIADDNKEFCDLVCEYLEEQPDLKVEGSPTTESGSLNSLVKRFPMSLF